MEKISFDARVRKSGKRATGAEGAAQPVCFDFVLTNVNSCAISFQRNWAKNRPGGAKFNTDSQLWELKEGSFLKGKKSRPHIKSEDGTDRVVLLRRVVRFCWH